MESMNNRIAVLDGLRAVAVLGVIWVHIWFFVPVRSALMLGSVDLNKIIGFIGTGVDLFFVISGFCLYLMYTKTIGDFTIVSYWQFIKKRWWRIAPAYYVAVIFSAVMVWMSSDSFPLKSIVKHFLFLNTIPPAANDLAPPFWSLVTECQFYLFLPVLFIFSGHDRKFIYWLLFLFFSSVVFRFYIFSIHPELEDAWKTIIIFRLPEFICGIYVAYLFIKRIEPPLFLMGVKGFFLALGVAFFGRILMTENSYLQSVFLKGLARAFGEPVLAAGYAMITWNVIMSESVFSRSLKSPFTTFIGKISYSMYLWHWWLLMLTTYWIAPYFKNLNLAHWMTFFVFLFFFIPFSYLSYLLLEAFYFKRKKIANV